MNRWMDRCWRKYKSVKVSESKEHYEKGRALNIHSPPPPFAEKKEKIFNYYIIGPQKEKNPII